MFNTIHITYRSFPWFPYPFNMTSPFNQSKFKYREWEFTSWLLYEGQNVVFAVITIEVQTFPDIFGFPPSIFIIFVSLDRY